MLRRGVCDTSIDRHVAGNKTQVRHDWSNRLWQSASWRQSDAEIVQEQVACTVQPYACCDLSFDASYWNFSYVSWKKTAKTEPWNI